MKRYSSLLLFLILCSVVRPLSAQSNTNQYVVITEAANIRSAPHMEGQILEVVYKGDILNVYTEPHIYGWYRVKLEGGFGYIHGNTIALASFSHALFQWSSSDNYVSEPFNIPQGLYFFSIAVDKFDIVSVYLTSTDGYCEDLVVWPYEVVSPDLVSRSYVSTLECNYVLEVEADSEWTISVEQISPDLIHTTRLDIKNGTEVRGIGDTATNVTFLPQGFWTITMQGEGDSIGIKANVIEGNCPSAFEFELGTAPITYQVTYRTEENCLIVWTVSGGTNGNINNLRAARWAVTFEKVR